MDGAQIAALGSPFAANNDFAPVRSDANQNHEPDFVEIDL